MMLFASLSAAFTLDIRDVNGTDMVIVYHPEDWKFLMHDKGSESGFNFYIDKGPFDKSSAVIIHTLLIFDTPKVTENPPAVITKIYSYGILNCENAFFSLLGEFYVEDSGLIKYTKRFEEGQWTVDLDAPGTVRHAAYVTACKDSI